MKSRVYLFHITRYTYKLDNEGTIPQSNPFYTFLGYIVIQYDESGEHFLRIKNATVEDTADYECIGRPRGKQKGIRSHAHLTVLIPPASVDNEGTIPQSNPSLYLPGLHRHPL